MIRYPCIKKFKLMSGKGPRSGYIILLNEATASARRPNYQEIKKTFQFLIEYGSFKEHIFFVKYPDGLWHKRHSNTVIQIL